MTVEEYKKSVLIKGEILELVHNHIPPSKDDSGTIENLDNLINDLVRLKNNVLTEENKKDQDEFNF